jgi:hypothetical protein
MTTLTAMELAGAYPDDTLVETTEKDGQHAVFVYMLKDGDVHKLMLSSEHVFSTAELAKGHIKWVAEQCVEKFKVKEDE